MLQYASTKSIGKNVAENIMQKGDSLPSLQDRSRTPQKCEMKIAQTVDA